MTADETQRFNQMEQTIENLDKNVEGLGKEVGYLKENMSGLDKKVDKILVALSGDELTNEGGYIQRVKDLEEEIVSLKDELKNIKDMFAKYKYISYGVSLAALWGGYEAVNKIIQLIIKL